MGYRTDVRPLKDDPADNAEQPKFLKRSTTTGRQEVDAHIQGGGSVTVNVAGYPDKDPFVEGTDEFIPVGGVVNETLAGDVGEDETAAARITPKRAFHVNLRDASGNELPPGSGGVFDAGNSTTAFAVAAYLGTPYLDETNLAQYFGTTLPAAPADTFLGTGFEDAVDMAGFGVSAGSDVFGQGYAIWERETTPGSGTWIVLHIETTPFAGAGAFFDTPGGGVRGRVAFQNRSASPGTFTSSMVWKRSAPGLFTQPVSAPVDPSFPAGVVKQLHMVPVVLTTTPLAPSGSYSTTSYVGALPTGFIFATNWADIDVFAWGQPFNAQGTLNFEFSFDGITTHIGPVPVPVNDLTATLPIPLRNFPFIRIGYDNNTVAQTDFLLAIVQRATAAADITRLLTQTIGPSEPVKVVRAMIEPSILGERKAIGADRTTTGEVVETERIHQVRHVFSFEDPNDVLDLSLSGGASVTKDATVGDAKFNSGTGATATCRAESHTVRYSAARESYFFFTARFPAVPTSANTKAWIGPLRTDGGFAIGYNGTSTPAVLHRRLGVDTVVEQPDWNGDPLDGSFMSRFNRGNIVEPIDFQKYNVWRIRYEWFGTAPAVFEILNPDGNWMTVHTFRFPNQRDNPFLVNPDVPLAVEITKASADAQDMEIRSACWAGGVAGSTSEFERILARRLITGEEMRLDVEPTNTEHYLGVSLDGAATADTVWSVIQITLSATKNPTRMRFRERIAWDDRATGW